jgi:hypothetical protein
MCNGELESEKKARKAVSDKMQQNTDKWFTNEKMEIKKPAFG